MQAKISIMEEYSGERFEAFFFSSMVNFHAKQHFILRDPSPVSCQLIIVKIQHKPSTGSIKLSHLS